MSNSKIYNDRLSLLRRLMRDEGFDFLAINAGKDLKHLTGLDFHLSERPAVLIIPKIGQPVFIFPVFEEQKVGKSSVEMIHFSYYEDPGTWIDVFKSALNKVGISSQPIGVSSQSIRFLEVDLIQRATGFDQIKSAEKIFSELYIRKGKAEIQAIQKAIAIAENALEKTLPFIKTGVSESAIVNQLFIHLLLEGSEPDLPFNPIVASGKNSANPHAVPGQRLLQPGDLLVIDWGARYDGYISDITRSFSIGELDRKLITISEIVREANQIARSSIRSGMSAREVDAICRNVIENANWGKYFTHRTGHGIGREAHEEPYICETNDLVLDTGMVFTIEPGVYIPNLGGIRIEDNVVITETTVETLTNLPREIRKL